MAELTDLAAAARRIVELARQQLTSHSTPVVIRPAGDITKCECCDCQIARDYLRLLEVEKAALWQPIETMPGPCVRKIVGRWRTELDEPYFERSEGHWYEFRGQREWSISQWYGDGPPTHWMPIPEPPALDAHRAKETT